MFRGAAFSLIRGKTMSKTKKKKVWWLILAAVLVVLAAVALPALPSGTTQEPAPAVVEPTQPAPTEAREYPVLKEVLRIEEIGSYTGLFVEDGSDTAVSGLLMLIVTNISEEPIQYAEITLDLQGETAKFALSVLPAGESAVLIEQNRMAYDPAADYYAADMACTSLAGFDREISMQEDRLQIQVLDGAINVTNISGADITGTILLCYKNVSNGVFHGGIAYRVRLEGGLKAGEIRQVMGAHFHQDGSRLLFVDIVE